jgi:adenosine deaminase
MAAPANHPAPPLAELHLHLYGTIRAEDYLERVAGRPVDWQRYEQAFEDAYGAAPPVREILERHRRGDPSAAADWKRLFVFGDADAGNFRRFQAKFDLLIAGSEFSRLDPRSGDLHPLIEEMRFFVRRMLADQRAQGIAYAEQRLLLGLRVPAEQSRRLLRPLLEEYAAAARDGIQARLAISLPREDPWPMWEVTRELALSEHGSLVTGIDFCFIEEGFPPREKAGLFAAVRDHNARHPERGLAILYHVGESFTDKSLESAVRWVQEAAELGAHRLGHALALGIDPDLFGDHERSESVAERCDQLRYDLAHADGLARHGVRVERGAAARELALLETLPPAQAVSHRYDAARLAELRARQAYAMERVRSTGAVVEVCPTSNLRIGGIDDPAHHPVHRFALSEVPFVVASDDPGIFDTTLARELDWVVRHATPDPDARRALLERAWRSRSEVLSGRERAA